MTVFLSIMPIKLDAFEKIIKIPSGNIRRRRRQTRSSVQYDEAMLDSLSTCTCANKILPIFLVLPRHPGSTGTCESVTIDNGTIVFYRRRFT